MIKTTLAMLLALSGQIVLANDVVSSLEGRYYLNSVEQGKRISSIDIFTTSITKNDSTKSFYSTD